MSAEISRRILGRQRLLRLVQFFFELCLLRRAPQDLPASPALLGVTLAVNLLMGTTLATAIGIGPGLGFVESLLDAAIALGLLYAALHLLDRLPRFQQSGTALMGSGALLGLVASVLLGLLAPGGNEQTPGGAVLLFAALVVWSILVMGHILRHTFEIRLGQGVGIAVLYTFLIYSLLGGLFSGA